MDLRRILQGGIFTFLVGKQHERFQVHTSIISDNSSVLHSMMCNGRMQESIKETAILEEVDPAIFLQFVDFCYFKDYSSDSKENNKPTITSDLASRLVAEGLKDHFCHSCGIGYYSITNNIHFPKCTASCTSVTTHCILCSSNSAVRSSDNRFCQGCATSYSSAIWKRPSQKLWDDFKRQDLGAMGMSSQALNAYLEKRKKNRLSEDLLGHAKLWVFADFYNVSDLKDLSLHKIHRDLVAFDLSEHTLDQFVDLFDYIDENTLALDDDQDGFVSTKRTPRSLLLQYTLCNTAILLKSKAFTTMLESGGSLSSEYTQHLMKAFVEGSIQKP